MTESQKVINWIASYPKSGNTWVRFLLLNLIYGAQSSTEKLDVLIPDIHKCKDQLRLPANAKPLVKTHALPATLMSLSLLDRTAAVLYIVRNPMDTMISNMNYAFAMHGITTDPAARDLIKNQYIEQFIQYRGEPWWIQQGMGSWVENIRSWINTAQELPMMILKYEDLRFNPVYELGRISDFLGLQSSRTALESAVHNSSFERMRNIEEWELKHNIRGFFLSENSGENLAKGHRFMYRGEIGAGVNELTPSQRERFKEQFGPTMELMGYTL